MTVPPSNTSCKHPAYRYDEVTIRGMRAAMSDERFATYLRLAAGDRRRALQFYTRNVALGSAFHGPLQALEVTLRNAIHNAMTQVHGTPWFENAPLRASERDAVEKARQSLRREHKPHNPGRIVAEVNFGFWVALFAKKYDATLWRTVLHGLFGRERTRGRLHDQLDRLRTLRNRIAHHEPILHRVLQADYDELLWLLGRLSPETAAWVAHHSRVSETLAQSSRRISRF